jgi:hypothetical protein
MEFAAGINSQNITIIVLDDTISDPWNALTIEIDYITCLQGGVKVNVDTSNHTVFIVDDEPVLADPNCDAPGDSNAAACLFEDDKWNEIGNMATGIYVYDFDSTDAEGTVCYVSGWLKTNIGELNNLIFSCYRGENPGMGLEEEAIYRQIFLKNHYAKKSRNALRGIMTSTTESESEGSSELITSEWTELRDGDSFIKRTAVMASPGEKNKTSKIYKEFADAADVNLKDLLHSYNLYKANPRQVAGKDAPAEPV